MKRKSVINWKLISGLFAIVAIFYFKLGWLLFVLLLFAIFYAIYIYASKSIPVPYLRKAFKSVSFLICVFLIAASIKILVLDIFFVPSNSMEELFFSGDIILVNKLAYGPKLPQSPFDIPWLNILFYFNDHARSRIGEEWWPYYRFGGYDSVHHGDVLVYQFDDVFVTKRCIALPGETIAMVNGKVFVNNREYQDPLTVKNEFVVDVKNNHQFYWKIDSLGYCCVIRQDTGKHSFIGNFSYKSVAAMKRLPEVKSIRLLLSPYDVERRLFANPVNKKWTLDNMEPFIVPRKGTKILLTEESFDVYGKILTEFEKIPIHKKEGKFFIKNTKASTYIFKRDYYFVLGDNRKNSDDSRVNGFVPQIKIIGKIQGKL
jgi:signal peptidase I